MQKNFNSAILQRSSPLLRLEHTQYATRMRQTSNKPLQMQQALTK